jgi:fimbrial chaperone protein
MSEGLMSRLTIRLILSATALVLAAGVGRASSLSVVPISLEVTQQSGVSALTVRNREPRPLNAQIRIFRWTQSDGQDRLEPTQDVVVSPPIVTINAGADYIVRLQRTNAAAISGEEAYRAVIDELPNPNRQRNGTIAVLLRYIVPIFFLSPDASQPKLAWSLSRLGVGVELTATNSGDKRIQIVDLKLATAARSGFVGKGLAGYVLGHSTRTWSVASNFGAGRGAVVTAASDHGAIRAPMSP